MHDRQISVRCATDELGISKTSLYEIISDYLGMKKVCTRWVPKLLTRLQLASRVDCCEEFLENCNQDPTEGRPRHGYIAAIHLVNKMQRPERNQAKRYQPDHESHNRVLRSS